MINSNFLLGKKFDNLYYKSQTVYFQDFILGSYLNKKKVS